MNYPELRRRINSVYRSPLLRIHRLATARAGLRPPPEFLIIGAQRCGTTSLYNYLAQHPNVLPPLVKEIHFFDENWERGLDWYLAHFPVRRNVNRYRTLEATPYYLFDPAVPARVRDTLPNARFIVLLRNPVARAISQYHHEKKYGREKLSFSDALRAEMDRLTVSDPVQRAHNLKRHSYLTRGLYRAQVERWLNTFPRERFFFLKSEDLYGDLAAHWPRLLRFTVLPSWLPLTFERYNAVERKGARSEVPADLVDKLQAEVRPLEKLTGLDLSTWYA